MAHNLNPTSDGVAPWHGIGGRYKLVSNEEFFSMFPENVFKVEMVPVRIVCQNTLAGAWRKPSRWERLKAWLSDTAERIVHNGE